MGDTNGTTVVASGKSADDLAFEARMAARAERKRGSDAQRQALERASMLALDDAEQQFGDDRVKRVVVAPLCIIVIGIPDPVAVKRWRQVSRSDRAKPADKMNASDEMGKSAVLWPTAENPCKVPGLPATYEALCEVYAGLPESASAEAVKLAGILDTEEVGK